MRKAKKLIAGIMLACMFIAGTGVEPSDVYAAGTTAGSLEMKTASDSINLNAGQSFDVTFSVNAETSGFGGYLTYDNSVFTSVTVVVDGGTTSGRQTITESGRLLIMGTHIFCPWIIIKRMRQEILPHRLQIR